MYRIDANTSIEALLNIAKRSLEDVDKDEVFTVAKLFRGFAWSRIPVGQRIALGSVFFAYATGEGSNLVEPGEKTKQNQQQYRKLEISRAEKVAMVQADHPGASVSN